MSNTPLVKICRSPGGEVNEVGIDEISGIRWDNITGGFGERLKNYELFGYIDYNLAKKLVDCSGMHNGNSAKILICEPNPEKYPEESKYVEGYQVLRKKADAKQKEYLERWGIKVDDKNNNNPSQSNEVIHNKKENKLKAAYERGVLDGKALLKWLK